MSDRRHARPNALTTPARAPLARAARAPAQNKQGAPSPLERYLGSTIRELRRKHGLTIADISERTGISRGMLSRIETGQTATSLETLSRLAQGLGVSLSALFRNYDLADGGVQLVKKGKGMEVARRGTRSGHTYQLLAYDQGPMRLFEPFLITIEHPSETFPIFEHAGVEFIYMLEGHIQYRHGKNVYDLVPGDALTFNGEVPHGPEKLVKCPIRFLSIMMYPMLTVE
ncbi:MAG TPA: XRE family transcriptional regulator [Burkholderiaceae bacterium]|jgi:transcriptional regulator with XRE-family HTH domain|nr:XRE family transcriptional regulator [Burkholderiaceae bacterium]